MDILRINIEINQFIDPYGVIDYPIDLSKYYIDGVVNVMCYDFIGFPIIVPGFKYDTVSKLLFIGIEINNYKNIKKVSLDIHSQHHQRDIRIDKLLND